MCLHGWGIHSYLWRGTMGALAAQGRRVHAIDLPGHGLSDRPLTPGAYTLSAFAAHLRAALDALAITSAPIIAQSLGGRVAVALARLEPARVRALALLGSVGFGEIPKVVALAKYLPVPHGPLPTVLVRRWMVALSKAMAYGRRAVPNAHDIDEYWAPTQFPDFLAALRQALIEFDWRPLAPEVIATISQPALVLFGTRDRTVRPVHAESLASHLPRGTFRWIRDAGHVANEEAPEEVNPILRDFIAEDRLPEYPNTRIPD